MLLNFISVIISMSSSCTEKCESCGPSLSVFSIIVTANMPVEGFNSFVYDPNDTMPYKIYSYEGNGASSQIVVYALSNECGDILGGLCGCPDSGGWNCYGMAAGTRSQFYKAYAKINSIMDLAITLKGNYRKKIITNLLKNSSGRITDMHIYWKKETIESLKTINDQLDPRSISTCLPEVHVPNPLCSEVEGTPPPCERSCSDHSYTNGGCSNGTSDISFMPESICTTSTKKRACAGSSSQTIDDNCPGDSWMRVADSSSREFVSSQVTEYEILGLARQAAATKVNLKKQNENTKDIHNIPSLDITEDGSCCRFVGQCDGDKGPEPVNFIGNCDAEYDNCSFLSVDKLPTTCNCSQDKDECWVGYSNITTPSEFSYTAVTIGAFKIAADINKEEFSKKYKSISGQVYFYIDSESEPATSPCCTSCVGIECFTGEILNTSSYYIISTGFKQDTRVTTSGELNYIYDSSEAYAIHPGKVIKTCYTIDHIEFI